MAKSKIDDLKRQLERGLLATRVGLHTCAETDKAIGAALDDMDPAYTGEAERLREKMLAGGADVTDADYERYLACLRTRYHLRRARGRLRTTPGTDAMATGTESGQRAPGGQAEGGEAE